MYLSTGEKDECGDYSDLGCTVVFGPNIWQEMPYNFPIFFVGWVWWIIIGRYGGGAGEWSMTCYDFLSLVWSHICARRNGACLPVSFLLERFLRRRVDGNDVPWWIGLVIWLNAWTNVVQNSLRLWINLQGISFVWEQKRSKKNCPPGRFEFVGPC